MVSEEPGLQDYRLIRPTGSRSVTTPHYSLLIALTSAAVIERGVIKGQNLGENKKV